MKRLLARWLMPEIRRELIRSGQRNAGLPPFVIADPTVPIMGRRKPAHPPLNPSNHTP